MPLVKRLANITDLNFIHGCILYGARKGHYSFDADDPALVACMKQEIQAVVTGQRLLDQRRAQASVYTLDNKRIATLIMSEAAGQNSGFEIYAMSVIKKYQHQGYGSQIMDQLLNQYQQANLYARCSPLSEKMNQLLESRGFRLLAMDDDYRILYKAALDTVDRIEPVYLRNLAVENYG